MRSRYIATLTLALISTASYATLITANITVTGDPSTGAGATITFNHDVNFTIENANSIGLITYHFGVDHDVTATHDNITASSPTQVQKNGTDWESFWRFQEARYDSSNSSALWTYDTGGVSLGDVITIKSGTVVTLGAGTAETEFLQSGTYYMWLQGNSGTLLAGEQAIPEPATMGFFALFGGAILGIRRIFLI